MSNQNALATTEPTDLAPTETATAQATAMARGQVEAQYLMAERHPRNFDRVRQLILKECQRSNFASEAIYSLPRGGRTIEGLSIRFAEGIRRLWGNMLTQDAVIYEDSEKRIVRVTAVDFETNSVAMSDVTVTKWMERRQPKRGDEVLGARTNSTGQTVYKVRVTDDDMRVKTNAEAARARRNRILELVPADLRDECMRACRNTMANASAQDPDAFRKQIVDGFTVLGVRADDLHKYLGHELDGASPVELAELRVVYQTVRDGEATWHECLAAKTGVTADGEEDPHADLKAGIADKLAASKAGATKKGKGKKAAKKSRPRMADDTLEARKQAKEAKEASGAVSPDDEPDDEQMRQPGEDG